MVVRLSALANGHVATVVAACADWPELAAFGPPYWRPRSEAELLRKVAATSGPGPATEYSFVLEDNGRLVGECSVHDIDWRNRAAQIGVCVWSPADRRSGYGRFGVEQMIAWGFGYLGLTRLEGWIVAANTASCGLVEQLGFVCEGTLTRRYLHGGQWSDVHVYAIFPG
ncbi:GNAT family N-acetyltransferase [Tsukamurella tyrosinosolvens]|uniref:GNAT family N-acetyltransferase n=1 Tax=Tsukamurella tyrosinosolvens TaxID=57704 RepID=UPI00079AE69F|nr:GNAT family protein [Tsukamurella tyrosinosolvens]KXP08404.1 GCN5 family acetyltransferase [Tsukamurella tyrosinosolvens]